MTLASVMTGAVLAAPSAGASHAAVCLFQPDACETLVDLHEQSGGTVAKTDFEGLAGPLALAHWEAEKAGHCTRLSDLAEVDQITTNEITFDVSGWGSDRAETRQVPLTLIVNAMGHTYCSFLNRRELI